MRPERAISARSIPLEGEFVVISREVYHGWSRSTSRVTHRDTPRVTHLDTPRVTYRDIPRVTYRDTPRVTYRDNPRVTYRDTHEWVPAEDHNSLKTRRTEYARV